MTDDAKIISMYRGQRVDEMSREDLIEAVTTLGRMLTSLHQSALATHEINSLARQARYAREEAERDAMDKLFSGLRASIMSA